MLSPTRRLLPALALSAAVAAPLTPAPARGDSLPARAVHVADYDMRVRFSPEAKTLEGQQRIVWRNPAPEAVSELWFHLYLNAFRNSESTFMRETRASGGVRGSQMRDGGWGGIDVTSLRLADGTDLAPALGVAGEDDRHGVEVPRRRRADGARAGAARVARHRLSRRAPAPDG